ncbi:anthranilate synthase component 1 [Vibrio profundum]|uniref:anthranilate synthase component 1 n=1 Tax=Vibrio profundum TaxID=2910247 RepID=UPI003D0AA9CF
MNQAITIKKSGSIEVSDTPVRYSQDPTQLFHTLCGKKNNSLLLESAEIDSKQNLQSLLLVDAAVRIECRGQQIVFEALSDNGQRLVDVLVHNISNDASFSVKGPTLTLRFNEPDCGLDEDSRLQQASSFDALRLVQHSFDLSDHNKHALFLGGLFAYDLVANFESIGEVTAENSCPDYVFYVAESLLVIDHQTQSSHIQTSLFEPTQTIREQIFARTAELAAQCDTPTDLPTPERLNNVPVSVDISDSEFCQSVTTLKQYVVQGDIFQVVPSRKFTLACPSPLSAYKKLKVQNPSPYMFYMQDRLFTLFGASPESALKYETSTNQVEIYPIAGTRARGKTSDGQIDLDLDGRIELELRLDKKENAEHMMLVDLARNDVARISQPGTRHLADLLKVARYSHVMHLVSRVVGQLRSDLDALHAYQASMNMGTLTGAPKIRAMQLIRQTEKTRRGSYGGAVGYLTGEGSLDTCIVIRSAYVENGIAQVQAGAGVVLDSEPQAEADETRAKAQAVISAIQSAHME